MTAAKSTADRDDVGFANLPEHVRRSFDDPVGDGPEALEQAAWPAKTSHEPCEPVVDVSSMRSVSVASPVTSTQRSTRKRWPRRRSSSRYPWCPNTTRLASSMVMR
jgi:hypothetical protein